MRPTPNGRQLADYDQWITASVLPKARTDFRMQPEEYALAFEQYGIDIAYTDGKFHR